MKLYLRILAFGKPYLTQGILGFVSLFIYNFFGIFSIALVIPFLQILFRQPESQGILDAARLTEDPGLMQQMYLAIDNFVLEEGKWTAMVYLCIALGSSIFLKSLFRYSSSYFIAPFEQGVIHHLRTRAFDHLRRLSMPFFTGNKKGNVINVMVSDVQVVQESVIGTVQNMVSDPVQMVLILASLVIISWQLTLFTLIILPITGLFINFISKSLKRRARRGQERLGLLIAVLDEFISGIRIVKAFGAEEYERKKYMAMNGEYRHYMVALKRRSDLASPVTEVLSIMVVVTIILYGGNLILTGSNSLQPESFIGFIALFGSFIQPIKTFSSALSRIQKGIASFQRIEEFLEEEETVKEKENAVLVADLKASVRYEGVRFSYESAEVLHGVDLELKRGETVALVGPSGGGKSTLADLLPRFYDPAGGRITLDGQDLRDLKVADLRGLIGVVTQEGVLFNDTVAKNIAYGEEAPDLARVEAAAKAAYAHDFISAMAEGYDTVIGERGTKLSGGQRQRLAIARAIYKDAPILVLDEATSALDSESERLVQEALDNLTQDRTSLVIAHRLSTIVSADRIYVIDRGTVVEHGTHAELLQKEGMYRHLFDIQFEATRN